jgi:biopolymer transport protein ExbD
MAEKQEKTREELIADWVSAQAAEQRKTRNARRKPVETGTVTINSLMDALFIILVFLLMNYSLDPLRVDSSDDLKLPPSSTDISPSPTAAVTVSAKAIVVNDELVVQIKDGQIDKAFKGGDENSLQIQPLFEALNEEAQRQKNVSQLTGKKFDGMLTIIAHGKTPYRLLTEVLYTAGQAEFQKFKFAVVKGGARGGSPE